MARNDYSLVVTPANQQRLAEYKQDDKWVVDFLMRSKIGQIATRWDDQPFITPSTFVYDVEKHKIYFHSNIIGRIRANIERHSEVCFETSEYGRFLPANVALEFSMQYESVIVFGKASIVEDKEEKRKALYSLIEKYFPGMNPGEEYRPITGKELKRTSLYEIRVESWSGKRNWEDKADQSDEWKPLGQQWFNQW